MMRGGLAMVFAAVFALAACDDGGSGPAPKPAELTRDDISHFGRMIVVDHKGPKGQIHLKGKRKPVWFSSVRDTIAFTMLPEESKRIAAIYVNDMARASWDRPEPGTWIDAKTALYVIGSRRRGGMGAPEPVPFATRDAAVKFAAKYGGRIVSFKDIPRDFILGSSNPAKMKGMGKDAKPGMPGMRGHGGKKSNDEM